MYPVAFQLSIVATVFSQLATYRQSFLSITSDLKPDCHSNSETVLNVCDQQTNQRNEHSPKLDHQEIQYRKIPFRIFQRNYLLVYLLAVSADWLQGPYVYALYSHYGFAKGSIAQLYIAGFASSAIFGTFVASLADKFGRRNNALLYCIAYILSCLTKHSSSFHILLIGRILGGIAYSILFSAFEAWMVDEHRHRSYPTSSLPHLFARAQFGNGIVAIVSGQLAGYAAKAYGKVFPFDLSILVLIVLFILLASTWRENYGDPNSSVRMSFSRAFRALLSDRKILLLGISQAAFEGAMYTFTFVWTPALQTAPGQFSEIPHGTIFSTFMACTMIGSNMFVLLSRAAIRVETVMKNVFIVGMFLFIVATVSTHVHVTYATFLCFEVLCGIYFPGMATVRAPYIPEQCRSSLLTFFRVPLNVIVVVTLYEDLNITSVFKLCAALMAIAAICMHFVLRQATIPQDAVAFENSPDNIEDDGSEPDVGEKC